MNDLEAKRREKAPRCDFCGEVDHGGTFACPRITKVRFDEVDGSYTVYLIAGTEIEVASDGGDAA